MTKPLFALSLAVSFVLGVALVACQSAGALSTQVKTGVTAAGELCTFINEFVDNGTLATICATASEIAALGHDVPAIAARRRVLAAQVHNAG